MVSSLLSLALQKEMKPKTAMTGEISLIGKILRIGGVKEKVIAAKRAGVETIILPQSNKSDYEQLPDFVKQGISANFVSDYSEIFKLIFPGVQLTSK
jgi:Lon-like ATP-dependent protease